MLFFERLYYEKNIEKYELGRYLLKKYENLPKNIIDNHNNIEELRKYDNKDFTKLKRYIIIGVRRTIKLIPNNKISDYLVPYTSSGCSAMCMYCYLVCHYNKCSYLRLFVNREDMLKKIIDKSIKSENDLIFEIGSNSDLILENVITHNLEWTIEEFAKINKGYITFPTKFDMVDSLLNLNHNKRCIIRMSINPEYIIKNVEFGTSDLISRIHAINKLVDNGYIVGIIIAPIIMLDNYEELYLDMTKKLYDNLNSKAKKEIFFEVIFMTYSYVHDRINSDAFPNSIKIYDKNKFKSNGIKYTYKKELLEKGKEYIKSIIKIYFNHNEIKYIV